MKKQPFDASEEALFFHWLGYRLFSTVLRGHLLGHKRPLSAARDYLRVGQLKGLDREASEFLVDVANIGRQRSLEETFEKWCDAASWSPSDKNGPIDLELLFDEYRRLREAAAEVPFAPEVKGDG